MGDHKFRKKQLLGQHRGVLHPKKIVFGVWKGKNICLGTLGSPGPPESVFVSAGVGPDPKFLGVWGGFWQSARWETGSHFGEGRGNLIFSGEGEAPILGRGVGAILLLKTPRGGRHFPLLKNQ